MGFLFWAFAARFYSTGDVGVASAAIAALGLMGSLSNLGLGVGLVRFLPADDTQAARLVNFSLSIILLTAIVVAAVFLTGIPLWSPGLELLRDNAGLFILFILFTAFTALGVAGDGVFVARRRAGFAMARGLSMNSLKLLLVVVLAAGGSATALFTSWGTAVGISLLLGLFSFCRAS